MAPSSGTSTRAFARVPRAAPPRTTARGRVPQRRRHAGALLQPRAHQPGGRALSGADHLPVRAEHDDEALRLPVTGPSLPGARACRPRAPDQISRAAGTACVEDDHVLAAAEAEQRAQ